MTGLECLGYKPRAKALQKQTKTSLAAFVEPRRNWEAPHSQLEPGSARHARTVPKTIRQFHIRVERSGGLDAGLEL